MGRIRRKRASTLLGVTALVVAACWSAACSGDDAVQPGSGGSAAEGGSAGAGGTSMGGSPSTGGTGGEGNQGGMGGEPSASLPAAAELNAAHGRMSGATFTLQFQLGRSFHQPTAAAGDLALECAAATN